MEIITGTSVGSLETRGLAREREPGYFSSRYINLVTNLTEIFPIFFEDSLELPLECVVIAVSVLR
jgi:hypothetical protein